MKIVCSQVDLKNNLSLVSRAVPTRPTHPILANVLLVANQTKNQVTLTGFDLSLGMRSCFCAEVEEEGVITLPAKLLNDIIARLPEGEVTISYEEEEMEENPLVTINSLSGKFQLRGVKGEEYPELPVVEREEAFLLPVAALNEGLKGSLFAASNDETKQILTGVHLTRNLDTLEFAATDGHRLAVVKTSAIEETKESEEEEINSNPPITEAQNFTITIPARALRELEKILSMAKEGESIALFVDEGQVVFELGQQNLTSRKLDGAYPNYNQLIPNNFERTMVVDRKRMIESLERVSVLSDQKNNLVKFTLNSDNEQVTLSVEAKELGNAKESISAEINGDNFEIGFNIRYLMDGLKALSANEIKFQFNGATQPVIATPLSGAQMTYLIMPVQIRD
ncbi:DNA polymerase III subunit beta [Cyanobacterium aponinum UTEX 3222]|uniref:Beta sliding clamp n=2 Tax=Cyanobacterium aponinum TaxID=379064 RepID=K9Z4F9_CYAAP|nr:DNA polymerase III subunit beta [Cyanobacterium aponinum]AFZ54071.1 DNA polymerase III, beta subunit [Cyanobacterium aponinum PCC 10605]MTF38655.1 DNA polymerase III subunit beta [Cyanobacterium aponinum 0216]PHV62693.1 DNA polymerase III subunit beta [Cyanobacterium aponinum IPPAS B-1201]WRL42112.1 DNA polymerase III subunit beta [Cyanobacterium aponinum UTEX 3222]